MSKQAVFGFFELLSKSQRLQEQIKTLSASEFVTLGKSNGFEFNQEQLKQVTMEIKSLKNSDIDQLSDEELEKVAGGFPVAISIICGTISLICAIDELGCYEGWWGPDS